MITAASSGRALLLLCLLVAESTSLAKSGKETKYSDSERVPLRQCNTLTLPLPTLDVAFETQRLASHSQSTLHEVGLVPHSLHLSAECPPQLTSAPRNNSYWSNYVREVVKKNNGLFTVRLTVRGGRGGQPPRP